MMNQQQLQQAAHRAIYEESTFDNPVDDERNTLLHIAVARGCIDTVRLLLSVGANASARNAHSKTPVDLAEEGGKQIILQIFNRWEFFRAVVSTGESSCDSSSQSKPPGSTVDLESLVPVEKMVVFNSSSVTTYEDYFDWTSSVRRFRLKVRRVGRSTSLSLTLISRRISSSSPHSQRYLLVMLVENRNCWRS